jgi:hypothetical protein
MRSALVENVTNIVVNIIMADPSVDPAPDGYFLIDVDNMACGIGWTYDPVMNDFINPNPDLGA